MHVVAPDRQQRSIDRIHEQSCRSTSVLRTYVTLDRSSPNGAIQRPLSAAVERCLAHAASGAPGHMHAFPSLAWFARIISSLPRHRPPAPSPCRPRYRLSLASAARQPGHACSSAHPHCMLCPLRLAWPQRGTTVTPVYMPACLPRPDHHQLAAWQGITAGLVDCTAHTLDERRTDRSTDHGGKFDWTGRPAGIDHGVVGTRAGWELAVRREP